MVWWRCRPCKRPARLRWRVCEGLPTEPSLANPKQGEYAMAKHKKSTFERLQNQPLNRSQRRALGRRLESANPGLEVVHRDAAGIDAGSASHFVAVPPDRDERPVREFGSWSS